MAPRKRQGLLLTLGGAPASPHVIGGLRGFYRPDVPTLVGEKGDVLSLEEAQRAAKDHSDVLKLVEVSDVKEAEEAQARAQADSRNELLEARRDGRAHDDVSRTQDEINAAKEA
jgi:uncharacterized protein with WD repeat